MKVGAQHVLFNNDADVTLWHSLYNMFMQVSDNLYPISPKTYNYNDI